MSTLVHLAALSKKKGARAVAPIAYLPEEPPLRLGRPHIGGGSNGESLNGSPRSRLTGSDALHGGNALIDATPEPWREIYQMELQLAEALRNKQEKQAIVELAEDVADWLDTEVTEEGFLESAASETPAAIPLLLRLRRTLGKHWRKRHERALKAILRRSCHLAVADGWLLGPDKLSRRWRRMLKEFASERDLSRSAGILPRVQRGRRIGKSRSAGLDLGACCEEAGLAVFQTGVQPDDARLALDFSSTCSMDLRLIAEPILRGRWTTSVSIDDDELPTTANWTQTCWHADEDGQFLEMRLQTRDFIVDRQIFLCRRAPVLFLVDALQVDAPARVGLSWHVPCPKICGLEGILPTRAQKCTGLERDLVIVPFGMPPDPLTITQGSLAIENGMLRAGVRAQGRVAVLPIAFVWGQAAQRPLSWRQLTITSDRRSVGADEAVAWRIAIAGQQVVYFRSLLGTHRLAFLGHQTFYETVIGPLDKKGDLEHWLMVDATPGEPLPH